jgi:anti-anti-sigma factor
MPSDPFKAFNPEPGAVVSMQTVGPTIFASITTPTISTVESRVVADALREALENAPEGTRHLVIGLDGVTMVNSLALGMFVSTYTSGMHRGITVILADVSDFVVEVLKSTRLDQMLAICRTSDDLEAALRASTSVCTAPIPAIPGPKTRFRWIPPRFDRKRSLRMLSPGTQILVRYPAKASTTVLHLGEIVDVEGCFYVVEIDTQESESHTGAETEALFHTDWGFHRQVARIEEVRSVSPVQVIVVSLIGEPIPAENRQHPRVSTVASDVIATVEDEGFCPVIDVSKSGFALLASGKFEVGDTVTVELAHDGETVTGEAVIRSAREIWEERYRYGLHSLVERPGGAELRACLDRIKSAIESEVRA